MNKEQKIKKLTWHYFWQQKAKEAFWLIVFFGLLFVIPFAFGMMYCSVNPDVNWKMSSDTPNHLTCTSFKNVYGLGWITILAFTIGVLAIYAIIGSNWNTAKSKAKRKVLNLDKI